MNPQTTANVSNLSKGLAHLVHVHGLDGAIVAAEAELDDARNELAAREDDWRDLVAQDAADHILIAVEHNIDRAKRHVAKAFDTLYMLEMERQAVAEAQANAEREADARVYAERRDDVAAEVVEAIDDLVANPHVTVDTPDALLKALVAFFTARVRRFERDLVKHPDNARLADQVARYRAALYVAMERPDVVSRLTIGMYVTDPAPAPEGWGRRVVPPVTTAPEGVEVVDVAEAARVELARAELVEGVLEEASAVESWERDVSTAMPPRELRAKWAAEWRRDGASEARPGLRTLAELADDVGEDFEGAELVEVV